MRGSKNRTLPAALAQREAVLRHGVALANLGLGSPGRGGSWQ